MKYLASSLFLLLLLLLFASDIQNFEFIVEEGSEKLAELFDLETSGFVSGPRLPRGRYQRSSSNEDKDSQEAEESVTSDDNIILHSYKIQSTITSRLANTMVQTKVENRAKHSQNLDFDVQIPKGAFIHNFTMNVNGITFTSSIKEKSAARSQYAQARAKGKAAGILRGNALDMENFKAELNVPGGTKVRFEIHYQQPIRRKLSTYEHIIPVQPGRLAKLLEVDIHIVEPQGIRFVHVPDTFGDTLAGATTVSKGEKKAHVSFKPTVAQQRQCPNCTTTAVDGNFVVTYDVNRDTHAGELEIFNGYFIHYFAPENLEPLPKNILFVIDVSGSMWGLKMKQVSAAPTPPPIGFLFEDSMGFDGIHIVSHLAVDDDSLHSSDEELLTSPMVVGTLQDVLYPLSPHNTHFLHGAESSGKESDGTTDSDPDDPASAAEANGEIIFAEALGK